MIPIKRREHGLAISFIPSIDACSAAWPFHGGNAAGDLHDIFIYVYVYIYAHKCIRVYVYVYVRGRECRRRPV